MFVQVYRRTECIAEMHVDLAEKDVRDYKVFTDNSILNIIDLPFGVNMKPDFVAFLDFMESRCPPRTRANIKELLEDWGLPEYDPLAIVKITHGLMWGDCIWIRFDEEDITYDKIKIRPD